MEMNSFYTATVLLRRIRRKKILYKLEGASCGLNLHNGDFPGDPLASVLS